MTRKKKPVARETPTAGKHPVAVVDPGAVNTERVSWRLSNLDLDGSSWSWRLLAPARVHEVHQKLSDCEQLTVGQLINRPGTKSIPVDSICKEARDRLVQLEKDDLDQLWELRFDGKGRVWGTMTGHVFSPLWWDPDHTVYPVGKKHT